MSKGWIKYPKRKETIEQISRNIFFFDINICNKKINAYWTPSTVTTRPSTEVPTLCAEMSISPPTVGTEETWTICGEAQARQERTRSLYPLCGSGTFHLVQSSQKISPQARQWWRRTIIEKFLLHEVHVEASWLSRHRAFSIVKLCVYNSSNDLLPPLVPSRCAFILFGWWDEPGSWELWVKSFISASFSPK